MSDDETVVSEESRPRRSDRHKRSAAEPESAPPPGYRATRRSGKLGKKARQAENVGKVRSTFAALVAKVGRGIALALAGIVGALIVAGLVYLVIVGINAGARWMAKRDAERNRVAAEARKVRENLLVIGVQEKEATGFLALRVDAKTQHVFGIAIPDGAFVEVPGQGFERIGDSYKAGPEVSVSAVRNYLSVPFDYYVVVDDAEYKAMMKEQDVSGLVPAITSTNLGKAERAKLAETLKKVPAKNVGLAPLPVRSVTIGTMTYYEPQRDQIADLLYSWWGVKIGAGKQMPRVIVYNGAGIPGIAGVAARGLIKAGFRVVDTGNADRFDYAKTQVVLLRGAPEEAVRVRDILGTGEVVRKESDQDITDIVIIIGKDYKPPS